MIKDILRKFFIALGLPVTRNIQYDILTQRILRKALKPDSNCVDVGAHKGEMLDLIRRYAPDGRHCAFEPIPLYYKGLIAKYSANVDVYPFALSHYTGNTSFHFVKDQPAYSGIKRRTYKTPNPEVELITVEVKQMDEVLASRTAPIHLIKIDVEGGELDVMRGARSILTKDRPLIVFECGKGASEFYENTPEMVFDFLSGASYRIYRLNSFLKDELPYDRTQFVATFQSGAEYYFIAQATV